MPLLPAPAQLSHLEKDALIAALTARLALADKRIGAQDAYIAAQDARIAALEARLDELTRPPKTPATHRSRPRKDRSKTSRPPRRNARRVKAAPASAGRCIRTPIERSTGAEHLPEVRGGLSRRVADPAADLRAYRVATRSAPT